MLKALIDRYLAWLKIAGVVAVLVAVAGASVKLTADHFNGKIASIKEQYAKEKIASLQRLSVALKGKYEVAKSMSIAVGNINDSKQKELYDVQNKLNAASSTVRTLRLRYSALKKSRSEVSDGPDLAESCRGYSEKIVNQFARESQKLLYEVAGTADKNAILKNKCVEQYNAAEKMIEKYNKALEDGSN